MCDPKQKTPKITSRTNRNPKPLKGEVVRLHGCAIILRICLIFLLLHVKQEK